jgi:anti-sigma-K factor RskA
VEGTIVNCPLQNNEGAELILDYCAQKLDADAVISLERHIAGCGDCARVVEAQRAVWEALDAYETLPAVSENFDERLWARIEQSENRSWWRKLLDGPALGWGSILSWKPAMVTAAACASVFAVMVVVQQQQPSSQATDRPPVVEKAMMERAVDLEQVEGGIEDIDMLKQLGVVDDQQPNSSQANVAM